MNTKMWRLPAVLLCLALAALSACKKSAPEKTASAADEKSSSAAKTGESKDQEASDGVSLTPEQIEKIGLKTVAVKAVDYSEETAGYGTVIPHEAIAQAVAEIITAQAAEKQSRSSLARTQRLSGTPGAMSADVEEANARQLAVDTAGTGLPWPELERRLIELGFVEGADVELLHEGLFGGDPIAVRVAHTTIALRRREAMAIRVTAAVPT